MADSATKAEWNATCGSCGRTWIIEVSDTALAPDRHIYSVCSACGTPCGTRSPLDIGETGAIQDPEWLHATELYDWDDYE